MRLKRVLILLLLSVLFPSICFAAIQASTVWEIRQGATANNVNGGGFTATGTDYSQQAAAELNNTDFATSGIGVTTLTSATGGLTSAMVGNIIHLTAGTNLTVGWYEITARTDTNTVTLDRAPDDAVGGVSSATGYVGGALSLNSTLDDDFFEQLVAGNIVYIKDEDSDFSLGENVELTIDGTSAAAITFEGYKTTRGDNPIGADRPVIAAAANITSFDNYWILKNMILTTTTTAGFRVDVGGNIINCKSTNTNAGANRNSFWLDNGGQAIGCEGISTLGGGFYMGTSSQAIGCYAHDSNIGFDMANHQNSVINSIADTCTTGGIKLGLLKENLMVVGNTVYGCGTGIDLTTAKQVMCINNILDANTTGASATAELTSNHFDYNCWDNTTDTSNVTKGDHSVTGDPGMTDPANGDFTLGSGSNCLDVGLQVGTDQGAVGDYKWNIGADQDDVAAAAGAGVNASGAIAVAF